MKKTVFILSTFFILLLISCDKTDKFIPPALYTEYFPLEIGNYIIYDVDSTSFSGQITKYHYELKDVIADTFYDKEKRLNFRIERYHRITSPDPWQLREVWTAIPSELSLITFEQNVNYVRLFFPVSIDQIWNINAYNNRGTEKLIYSDIHKPFKMGTVFVDSSVTVVEKADTQNLVRNEFRKRIYGFHTGLVYLYCDSLKLEFHPQRKGDTLGGYQLKYIIKAHNY